MNTKKKQHFVPKLYLRRFTQDDEKIFVFDKFNQKVFIANVANVAEANYFYNVSEEMLTDDHRSKGVTVQFIEDAFAKIEDVAQELIKEFLKRPRFILHEKSFRVDFAAYIYLQILRTKETRDMIIEGETRIRQMLVDDLVAEEYPDLAEKAPSVVFNEENSSLLHAKYIFDNNALDEISDLLSQQIWMVAVNRTTQPLYTSDQPVLKKYMTNKPLNSQNKFSGVKIFFPITPELGVLIFDGEYYSQIKDFDGGTYILTEKEIQAYNKDQVIQCYRQTFSIDGDFTMARAICSEQPGICTPDISRIEFIAVNETAGDAATRSKIMLRTTKNKIHSK